MELLSFSTTTNPRQAEADFWAAAEVEQSGDIDTAVQLYTEILNTCKDARAALNLGSIAYNRREFVEAEAFYRRATEIDPQYAMAFFNLGNVLDELRRIPEAIEAYQTALRLCPRYADVHYNLALIHERDGQPRRALKHWSMYLKLDSSGEWADHARRMIRKTLDSDRLSIVWRRETAQVYAETEAEPEPEILPQASQLALF